MYAYVLLLEGHLGGSSKGLGYIQLLYSIPKNWEVKLRVGVEDQPGKSTLTNTGALVHVKPSPTHTGQLPPSQDAYINAVDQNLGN